MLARNAERGELAEIEGVIDSVHLRDDEDGHARREQNLRLLLSAPAQENAVTGLWSNCRCRRRRRGRFFDGDFVGSDSVGKDRSRCGKEGGRRRITVVVVAIHLRLQLFHLFE